MSKEQMKRATLESLMQRAQQRKESDNAYKEYESRTLGQVLLLKKLPISRICEIMDMSEGDTMRGGLEINIQLIYESIPLLQDKDLQEAYECVEPYDIVGKILDDNMGEIQRMCEVILSMYGLGTLEGDLKN